MAQQIASLKYKQKQTNGCEMAYHTTNKQQLRRIKSVNSLTTTGGPLKHLALEPQFLTGLPDKRKQKDHLLRSIQTNTNKQK